VSEHVAIQRIELRVVDVGLKNTLAQVVEYDETSFECPRRDSYVLDLQQAKTCDERRAVIGKLRELGDSRASSALRRAKAQFACIERDAADALAALEPTP
jgi:hypothetical protein